MGPRSAPNTPNLGLLRFDCNPDAAAGGFVVSLCRVATVSDFLHQLSLCEAPGSQPCPEPAPPGIPSAPGGCLPLPVSGYGFTTVGCTIGTDRTTLHAFDCAGMTQVLGATCGASSPGTSSLDARFPKTVQGSWVPGNVQFTVQNLRPNVSAVTMVGSLAPNGQLALQFDSLADASPLLDTPTPVFAYKGLAANKDSSVRFSAVTASVSTTSEALCVTPDYQASALMVTVSLSCPALSRAAIIGIAVSAGAVGIAAAIVVALLTRLFIQRRTQMLRMRGQQKFARDVGGADYVHMK